MKVQVFAGSDQALRRHALNEAIPKGTHALDIGRFDMSTPWGRQHGAAAVAMGPLVGDRRVVVWESADALSKLSPVDPVWTLLLKVSKRPRPDITLLVEGESIAIPVDGWSGLIARGQEQTFNTPSKYRPQDQLKLVEVIAKQVGVDLVDGTGEAVLEACGSDSARIRHLLERLQLTETAITPAMVRAGASPEALSVFDFVDAALNGNKPRALRAAAAVSNSKAKVGEILRVIQKQALQQLVLVETLNADKSQVAKILGFRKSGVVYFRRQELPMLCQPERVLSEAIELANEVTEGLRPTPRQVVQRLLISAFGTA